MATGSGTVNKVILLGRLGRDPELRYTPAGAAVANFSIATNRVWKDQNDQKVEQTDWHNIVAWRTLAEFSNTYLKKGSLVYIEGRLQTRNWTDQNNVTHYRTEIIAETIQMVGPKPTGAGEPAAPPMEEPFPEPPQPEPGMEEPPDDLPF